MANPDPHAFEELLVRFVNSRRGIESDAALDALFAKGVRPLVISILRRKFNASLSHADFTQRNLDALDLASDIDLRLLKVFQRLRDETNGAGIANPAAYVHTVINNAFRQYVRDKYPQRLRLRNKITYIVRNSRRFAAWQGKDGGTVCGPAEWAGRLPAERAIPIGEIVPGFTDAGKGADDNDRLIKLISAVFAHMKEPVGLDELVLTAARVLGVRDSLDLALDEVQEPNDESALEHQITQRISLQRFWEEIASLPLPHLTALLLNLRGERGENILAFLPMLRIASVREIAKVLEMEPTELAAIWNRLPLDDNLIAERLGVTRQQVINLRQSARTKLKRSGKDKV